MEYQRIFHSLYLKHIYNFGECCKLFQTTFSDVEKKIGHGLQNKIFFSPFLNFSLNTFTAFIKMVGFLCDVELNIHQTDYWDRLDETGTSYSQTPRKLEATFSSKVRSSLVEENILKCWFKQFDSRSKGKTHFRITRGQRGNEPCQFFVKQFSALFRFILSSNICMKAFNVVIFLETFCGNIVIFVQIQKPSLASTGNDMWNPNSLLPF